ncbi:hypothetical protein EON71_00360 [bacterium]|nr:MAG: hypothetical protein EON71_00360 [bacterium]
METISSDIYNRKLESRRNLGCTNLSFVMGDEPYKTDPIVYSEIEPVTKFLIKSVEDEQMDYNKYHKNTKKTVRYCIVLLCLIMGFLATAMHETRKYAVVKTNIEEWLEDIIPEVNRANQKIEILTNHPTYKDFVMKNYKTTNITTFQRLKVYKYLLDKFPKDDEAVIALGTLQRKLDKYIDNMHLLSEEDLERLKEGIHFSCEKMTKEGYFTTDECNTMIDWDDIIFVQNFNLHMIEDIIPETKRSVEFCRIAIDRIWKYHKMDSNAKYYDNFLINPWWYTLITLVKTDYPVFFLAYELITLMKIAPIAAQTFVLEGDNSVYYYLTTENAFTYIVSLYVGYGVIYVPIVFLMYILNCLYNPMTLLHILHQRILSTLDKVFYCRYTVRDNTKIFYTSKSICLLVAWCYFWKYVNKIVLFVLYTFVISNLISVTLAFALFDNNPDHIGSMHIWCHEVIMIYENLFMHMKQTTLPLVYILIYTISIFAVRFIVAYIYYAYNNIHLLQKRTFCSVRTVLDQNGSIFTSCLRFLLIIFVNYVSWYYSSVQIIDFIWNTTLKTMTPIPHFVLPFL